MVSHFCVFLQSAVPFVVSTTECQFQSSAFLDSCITEAHSFNQCAIDTGHWFEAAMLSSGELLGAMLCPVVGPCAFQAMVAVLCMSLSCASIVGQMQFPVNNVRIGPSAKCRGTSASLSWTDASPTSGADLQRPCTPL